MSDISAEGLMKLLRDLKTKSASGPGNMIVHMVMGEAWGVITALRAALDRTEADKAAAVEAERERCWKTAAAHADDRPRITSMDYSDGYMDGCKNAAAAIRAQGVNPHTPEPSGSRQTPR